MSYATPNDALEQLGEAELVALTDRLNTGEVDEDVLNRALRKASGEIDSYIATRYVVPVAVLPVPEILVTKCIDIAQYHLCRGGVLLTEDIKEFYHNAIKWLGAVSAGKVSLGIPTIKTQPDATVVNDAVQFMPARPSVFGRGQAVGDDDDS